MQKQTPKIEENLYQKTLFIFNVFHVFIACLPELDQSFADCDIIYGKKCFKNLKVQGRTKNKRLLNK